MSSDTPHPEAPGRRGYETRDVKWSVIAYLALAVVLLTAFSQLGLWLLLGYYRTSAAEQDPQLPPLVNVEQVPPRPRLQSAPMLDYAEFIKRQQEQLESYGWIDKQQGIVRIPVARAIDIALERGLPKPAELPAEDKK